MQPNIFRSSLSIGTALLSFGLAYYSILSHLMIPREEEHRQLYWTARGDLDVRHNQLDAVKRDTNKPLSLADLALREDAAKRGIKPPERLLEEQVALLEARMNEQKRLCSLDFRERAILIVGSFVSVFGGIGLIGYGFFGWRRLNEAHRTTHTSG